MGLYKEENIVSKWYKQLSQIESEEISNLCQSIGCPEIKLPLWRNLDDAVVHTIISQMLSSKAASSILNNVYNHFGTSRKLLSYITLSDIQTPLYGVSIKKQKALYSWANSSHRRRNINVRIKTRSDVYNTFKCIWGLGEWSIDMLSIFYFCLSDIWPESDLGIIKYTEKYFKGNKPDSIAGLETITSLCIWHGIDKKII